MLWNAVELPKPPIIRVARRSGGGDKKIISPPGTKPDGNYSQGILTGGTVACKVRNDISGGKAEHVD